MTSRDFVKVGDASRAFAANMRRIRNVRGMSLRSMAKLMQEGGDGDGVYGDTLSRMEIGKRRITIDDLVAVAKALDVSPAALLVGAGQPCARCGDGPPKGFICTECGRGGEEVA